MKKVIRIDNEGFYLEDVVLNDGDLLTSDCIEIECPNGFYKPLWDGTKWTEGATQEYINSLKNQVRLPTAEERLQALENAITVLMGV